MKLFRTIVALICALLFTVGLVACTTKPNSNGPQNGPSLEEPDNNEPGNKEPDNKEPDNKDPEQGGGNKEPEVVIEGKCTVLADALAAEGLKTDERQIEALIKLIESANSFAAKLSPAIYKDIVGEGNIAISPLSVYMALAMAAECAAGETRQEIVDALGVTYEQLRDDFTLFYRAFAQLYKDDNDQIAGLLDLSNSIWIDENLPVNQSAINSLADKFFCNSRSADFLNDNKRANQAIRNFVKDKTHGLIDHDFELPIYTVFAIINTLYLKDVWNFMGEDIELTEDCYTFDGLKEAKSKQFLSGGYNQGKVYEAEDYTSYYTNTAHGYKIKFILPKEGHVIKDVFTAENITAVNALDYRENAFKDDGNYKIQYTTRCIFPEFEASLNKDLIDNMKSTFGIKKMFDEYGCDFSGLVDYEAARNINGEYYHVYCKEFKQVTKLKVDKKGIEGAAVTIIVSVAEGSPLYEYCDFVVDKAFGYVITDSFDNILFTGVVEDI